MPSADRCTCGFITEGTGLATANQALLKKRPDQNGGITERQSLRLLVDAEWIEPITAQAAPFSDSQSSTEVPSGYTDSRASWMRLAIRGILERDLGRKVHDEHGE